MKKLALLLFISTILFGCGSSSSEKSEVSISTSTDLICETCGKSFSGLGWFDDFETGWRPAGANDLIIKNICSKICGKQYNRKDGDKPDNWSTKLSKNSMIYLFLILSLVIGCAVSSFFGRRKNENYYFFRTYQLYKESKVDLFSVIIAGFINLMLGAIILGLIAFKFFHNWISNL